MKWMIVYYALNLLLVACLLTFNGEIRHTGFNYTLINRNNIITEDQWPYHELELKCLQCSPELNKQKLSEYLKKYFQNLKKFITYLGFHYLEFRKFKKGFRNAILEMEFFAATKLDQDELDFPLKFARSLFETMDSSVGKLRRFSGNKNPGYRQVHDLIDLKIRALALYDLRGFLDRSINDYVSKIFSFEKILLRLNIEMEKSVRASVAIRRTFKKEGKKVKETLEDLRQQLSEAVD